MTEADRFDEGNTVALLDDDVIKNQMDVRAEIESNTIGVTREGEVVGDYAVTRSTVFARRNNLGGWRSGEVLIDKENPRDSREREYAISYVPLTRNLIGVEDTRIRERAFQYATVASVMVDSINKKQVLGNPLMFSNIGVFPPPELRGKDKADERQIFYAALNGIAEVIGREYHYVFESAAERVFKSYEKKIKADIRTYGSFEAFEYMPSVCDFERDLMEELITNPKMPLSNMKVIPFDGEELEEFREYLHQNSGVNFTHQSANLETLWAKELPGGGVAPMDVKPDRQLWDFLSDKNVRLVLSQEDKSNPTLQVENAGDLFERYHITPDMVNAIFTQQLGSKFFHASIAQSFTLQSERIPYRLDSFSEIVARKTMGMSYQNLTYASKAVREMAGKAFGRLIERGIEINEAYNAFARESDIADGTGLQLENVSSRSGGVANYHSVSLSTAADVDGVTLKGLAEEYGFSAFQAGAAIAHETSRGSVFNNGNITQMFNSTLTNLSAAWGIDKKQLGMGIGISYAAMANQNRIASYDSDRDGTVGVVRMTGGKLGAFGHEMTHALDQNLYFRAMEEGVISKEQQRRIQSWHSKTKNYSGSPRMLSVAISYAMNTPGNTELLSNLEEFSPGMVHFFKQLSGEERIQTFAGRTSFEEIAEDELNKAKNKVQVDGNVRWQALIKNLKRDMNDLRNISGYMERHLGELPPDIKTEDGTIPLKLYNSIRDVLLYSGDERIVDIVSSVTMPVLSNASMNEGNDRQVDPIDFLRNEGMSPSEIRNALAKGIRNLSDVMMAVDPKALHKEFVGEYHQSITSTAEKMAKVVVDNISPTGRASMEEKWNNGYQAMLNGRTELSKEEGRVGLLSVVATNAITSSNTRNIQKEFQRHEFENFLAVEDFSSSLDEKFGIRADSGIALTIATLAKNTSSISISNDLLALNVANMLAKDVDAKIPGLAIDAKTAAPLTDFLKTAGYIQDMSMSKKNYWNAPQELLARAGEAYIASQMKNLGLVDNNLTKVEEMRNSEDSKIAVSASLMYPSELATEALTASFNMIIDKAFVHKFDWAAQIEQVGLSEMSVDMTGNSVSRDKTAQMDLFAEAGLEVIIPDDIRINRIAPEDKKLGAKDAKRNREQEIKDAIQRQKDSGFGFLLGGSLT